MLYWLLFEKLFPYFGPFRVVQYATFRTAFASLTALFLCIVLGPMLIAKLREFQIGQHIREDGPKSHHKKAGTPTMGGVLIVVSIVIPTLLWANLHNQYVWIALFAVVSFGAIGFYDDFTKVKKMQNLGLTARKKLFLQSLAAMVIGFWLLALHAQGHILDSDERAVLQDVYARHVDRQPAAQPVDVSAGIHLLLRIHVFRAGRLLQRA